MATRKAKGKTQDPAAKTRRSAKNKGKASPKKSKASAKARKSSLDVTKVIKGVPGLEEHFYKKFPRYAAYKMLVGAKNRTLKIGAFLTRIEKLDGVANRKQAMGIVQKLLTKNKSPCGSTFAQYV